jgi:hypothetical protein
MQAAVAFTGVDSITDLTSPTSTAWFSKRKKMISDTMSPSSLDSTIGISPQDVNLMGSKPEMSGITAGLVVTDVVNNGNISTKVLSQGTDQPSINKPMSSDLLPIKSNSSISGSIPITDPDPTSTRILERDLGKDSGDGFGREFVDNEHSHKPHYTQLQAQKSTPSKGIIYYTDNQLNLRIARAVQGNLKKVGLPIVSASLKPMNNMGENVHLPLNRGYETYFKQIIAALEKSTAEIVFFCEHDNLMHASHFEFTPQEKDKFYYDLNWWKIRSDGFAVHWDANQVSGLCCYREHALEWYKKRLESYYSQIKATGKFDRKFEPNDNETSENWKAPFPSIDIRHDKNLTYNKWSLADFRDKSTAANFEESTVENIKGWDINLLKNLY